MTNRTLSIEIPDSARIPEGLGQGALEYLFMDVLRSRGWIDSADVECLAGERAREFEEQLAGQSKTCWSPRFVEELTAARSDDDGRQTIEEMVAVIAANRTRKAPPAL